QQRCALPLHCIPRTRAGEDTGTRCRRGRFNGETGRGWGCPPTPTPPPGRPPHLRTAPGWGKDEIEAGGGRTPGWCGGAEGTPPPTPEVQKLKTPHCSRPSPSDDPAA